MATLKLEIVTPERRPTPKTSNGHAPGSGRRNGHLPTARSVDDADRLRRSRRAKGGQDYFLAIGEGFVEITGDRVAIMTDMAIRAENIDEAKAEEARKRAEARLAEKLDDEQTAAALRRHWRIPWRSCK